MDLAVVVVCVIALIAWCVDRIQRKRFVKRQMAEDTCTAHDVFCCGECFDQEPL